jgi:hypothetical protein
MALESEYELIAGWKLCAIKAGSKGPNYEGWNTSPMPAEAIEAIGAGAGLLHSLSGTAALDIDDLAPARAWWAARGVDLDALRAAPESVHISSGRAGRDKLLYRLAKPLRTVKPKGHGFELRCATAGGESVQDVLPGAAIHPITKKPYTWAGDWTNLPNIPAAVYTVWRELTDSEPVSEVVNEKPQAQPIEYVRAAVLAFVESRKLDMDNYDDWINIGMRIHKQTDGGMQGFKLWTELSQRSPKYAGSEDLKNHWMSFDSGGRLGLEVALREVPATADEFAEADPPTMPPPEKPAKEKRSDALRELERRLVYVKDIERYFDTERHRQIATDSGLQHMFTSMIPRRNGKSTDPVKYLKESATKIVVDRIGFHPGEGVMFQAYGATYANQFRPMYPAELDATPEELEIIEWLFNRIDDAEYRSWLRQFYAYVVQYPGVKIKSAPLIWSETQGNGKTTLVRKIPALLVGEQYSREVNYGVLNSDFNDVLLDAWHVNLTEFRAGSRGEREAISKKVESWIADDVISIHPKGRAGFSAPNHFFLTASSNSDDAALITNQDRKWAIHELTAPQFTETQNSWVYNFLNGSRAPGVLRRYFLNVDTAGFAPSARAPQTAARAAMVRTNVANDLEALQSAFEERIGPFERDVVITREVKEFIYKHSTARPTQDRIAKLLCKPPFNGMPKQFRSGSGMYRCVVLYNQKHWMGAGGKDIMAHIQGDDIAMTDDDLLT